MLLLDEFMSSVFIYCVHHLTENSLFKLCNIVVVYFKVSDLETDLILPSFKNSLPHLTCPPVMSVLVQKSPPLEDINLVEP